MNIFFIYIFSKFWQCYHHDHYHATFVLNDSGQIKVCHIEFHASVHSLLVFNNHFGTYLLGCAENVRKERKKQNQLRVRYVWRTIIRKKKNFFVPRVSHLIIKKIVREKNSPLWLWLRLLRTIMFCVRDDLVICISGLNH